MEGLQNHIDIPSVEIHTSCVCYHKGDKSTIRQVDLEYGALYSLHLEAHNIVSILKGRVRVSAHNVEDDITLSEDDLIFLPASTKIEIAACDSAAALLFSKLENLVGKIPECDTFRLHRSVSPETLKESGLYPLRASERIKYFLEGLLQTEEDGLKCESYAQLMVNQLMFLIQVYYTQEEYTRFYSTVLSPDVAFSNFVIENWRQSLTVKDLAETLNMTPQQFTLRFRKVFGTAPGSWLLERKAEYIYYDICSSHKSLKSIAMEYGFSMPNFTRFCRMMFGSSPGAIRERLNNPSKNPTDPPVENGRCKIKTGIEKNDANIDINKVPNLL